MNQFPTVELGDNSQKVTKPNNREISFNLGKKSSPQKTKKNLQERNKSSRHSKNKALEETNLNSISPSNSLSSDPEASRKENSLSHFTANTQDLNRAITMKTFDNALFNHQPVPEQSIISPPDPSSPNVIRLTIPPEKTICTMQVMDNPYLAVAIPLTHVMKVRMDTWWIPT